ncbi:MAG: phenylalanine--tRNA ligase subunit beta [Planctomycetota bacterium]|jgi:phenylalanyl-tRNA synthetase beta chain|nr:phenylalanine--tRNA ligase subunit beta [Planctomycetota bacterium]
MRISLNWIKRILNVDSIGLNDEELVRRLTLHLAEIDEVETTGASLDGVVVGKVLTCAQHPDADRLRVTTLDVGADDAIPVVCGAPNVAAGQSVAVALPGCQLTMPGKDGEPVTVTIKKGKLRGQPSHGMICAEDELGLGTGHDGIMVLTGEPQPGTALAEVLPSGDTVLVVDNHNINHRPDLWGHLGWAREIAAICGLTAPNDPDISWADMGSGCAVHIADERCSGYRGAVVTGVANTASPQWMQDLLEAAGVRPLGLLVDLTNYVMLELGEPMHAFDQREIAGDTIVVRAAAAGEKLQTLDERERDLVSHDLVIADAKRVLALAGIMGGEGSGVKDDTSTIVLEAATFQAASIRHSRIRHGMATESSSRFEKTLYREFAAAAINRAIALLSELCPNASVTCRFSAAAEHADIRSIAYQHADLTRYVGIEIPAEQQNGYLSALGFVVADGQVRVPWWRAKDVEEATDLVEEIARLHGYHHVTPEVPRLPAATPALNPLRSCEHRARRVLSAQGWDEVQTYGFTSAAWAKLLAWPADTQIQLTYPLSSEQTVMRLESIPTLAEAVARNRRFVDQVAIYEIGKVYGKDIGVAPCSDETLMVSGCTAGTGATSPFYAARDAALALLAGLGYEATYRVPDQLGPAWQSGRSAEIVVKGQAVGLVGELSDGVRGLADSDEALAAFVIELERLVARLGTPAPLTYSAPSRYQSVDRDFTFLCPESLPFGDLMAAACKAGGKLVRSVGMAQEIYRGDGVPDDHKAMSIRVLLQADDRTLSEKELRKVSDKIVKTVEHTTAARLRA